MAKLRVGLCITDLDVGGAERALVDLATRVDRSAVVPVVYCLGPRPVRIEASCVPPLERAGIEHHFLGGRRAWDLPRVVSRLTRLLARHQPDLLQTFLFHANFVGRIAARRARVPRVVSGIRVAERHSRWHLWADRCTSRFVDRYVCVSQAVSAFSVEKGGLPPAKMVVIPNGVDLTSFPAREAADLGKLGIVHGNRVATFIGRLHQQKGVEWLVEAAPHWLDRLPNCTLLIVGQGPLETSLQRTAREGGYADRIRFAGWRADVPEILAASDLLVLPSQWEGMPNAVLQAMATRLPVLATQVEGVRELLGPGAEAQTVPYGDTERWVERVVAVLSEASLARKLGENNRHRAESHFQIQSTVASYQDLWRSLVGR